MSDYGSPCSECLFSSKIGTKCLKDGIQDICEAKCLKDGIQDICEAKESNLRPVAGF